MTSFLASLKVDFRDPELCDLDANSSYDFHLQIRDRLNSLSSLDLYFVIPQGTPLLALRRGLVGINTPTPDAALHVVGNTHLEGSTNIQGNTRIIGTLTPDVIDYAFEKPCYGSCSTAADVGEKQVVCPDFGSLKKGALVAVQFSDTNTVGTATLNVNNTGARPICGQHGYYLGANMWIANQIVLFAYNGNWWMALNLVPATTDRYGPTKLTNSVSLSDGSIAASAYAVKQAYDRSSWPSISLSSPLALAYGGTGADTAVNARSNLGLYCTALYSGSLSSGSVSFSFGNYKAYIITGAPNTNASRMSIVIPQWAITSYETNWQIADESYYRTVWLYYSGSYAYLRMGNGSGYISNIYGVN